MKPRNLILSLAVLVAAGPFSNARAQKPRGPIHITSVAHAVSHPPDSSGAASNNKNFGPARVIPLRRPDHTGLETNGGGEGGPAAPSIGNWTDADVQTTYGPSQLTVSNVFGGVNFTGQIPPDENLSVGINTTGANPATQIVDVVNTSYTIFTASGQGIKSGYLNGLFAGLTSSMCSSVNGGDPIALFDKLDGRWIISQLAYNSTFTDNHLCLAISQTSDATGAYNAYDFSFGSNLPDYPKLAVWPDGIYFSANIYASNGSTLQFQGAQACSFPRGYVTNPPTSGQITFSCSPGNDAGIYNILPADLENLPGTASLPTGPDYYMQYVDNVGPGTGNDLRIYQLDANAGSLNVVNDLTVNDFHDACGGGTCVPQEGATQQLDSLGDRLMYRLSFRSYSDHDQMVANHSVQINSSDNQTGVRWYIIRRDQGGAFYVNKESTYSPDVSTYRWMGSIAQNKNGDLGLGYSVSGVTTFPGIAVTGLKNGADTLMEQEQRMYHGTDQSYQGTYSRWGDYSSISVDPTDDCSFWYTNEYVKPPVLSFDFLWNTVIGKISFGDCSVPSFIITTGALPGGTVNTAYSATLTATGGTGSYTWSISAGSLPAGLTLNTSTGAITGTPTTAGTSNFTAKVTDSNSQTATQNLSITVNAALSITTTSLPGGTVGTAYSSTLAATGGTGSYTWSISAGSLPAGLTLNTSTGAITG
ncbi:MAG TPA: Ig domain-containing protein, partial [Terriglobia bacterium]|nr:Ig domain-containing protein [Terriglobia bacterium]